MTLARFTPSILPGETLEQLFVHRHHLLDDVMAAVHEAAEGDGRRHRLFVGPRGAGKTHLLSLVSHRVQQARAQGLRVGLSWLMEDPWEIETYDDLIDQVLAETNLRTSRAGGEYGLLEIAKEQGPIVLILENLDQVLEQIGGEGQRRLRSLLENTRSLLLVASTTRLSQSLQEQAEPFYGFFDVTQLQPFTVLEAADMLREVARLTHNESLMAILDSPLANSRLATISHLAGGQPRVWALLGAGLTDSGIDDMVEMLLSRFDDLTPYYQEQLARLSPSERKVVRRLADADRPLTVGRLANLCSADPRSISKTVSDLRKRGWVLKHESILTERTDSRQNYYELSEPLARIAFQVKSARGEPIRLAVDFLSTWFEREKLLEADGTTSSAQYRRAAAEDAGLAALLVKVLSAREIPPAGLAEAPPILSYIQDGLAAMDEDRDVSALMSLPAPIMRLIAERLRELPVIELRLRVCEFAVVRRADGDWRNVLDSLVPSLVGESRARALACLVVLESDRGPIRDALLDQIDDFLQTLPYSHVEGLYSWIAVGVSGRHESPGEPYLRFRERPIVRSPGGAFLHLILTHLAAVELARAGESQRAQALAEAEYDAARRAGASGLADTATFVFAKILLESNEPAGALALINGRLSEGLRSLAPIVDLVDEATRRMSKI